MKKEAPMTNLYRVARLFKTSKEGVYVQYLFDSEGELQKFIAENIEQQGEVKVEELEVSYDPS